MKLSDMPLLIDIPFARDATVDYVRSIPDSTTTSGEASYTLGFPPITAQPLESGGIPPSIKDFNGILRALSQWTNWANAGAPVNFDSTFAGTVGGYPKGALLSTVKTDATAGRIWRSTADDNSTDPDGGSPANWEPLVNSAMIKDQAVVTAALADQNVTNAKLANGNPSTVKGRAATGNTTDLTMSQLAGLMAAFTGDSGTGGVQGLVPAPGPGNGASGYVLRANGTFGQVDLSLQATTIHSNSDGFWFKLGPLIINVGVANSLVAGTKRPIALPSGAVSAVLWYNAGVKRNLFDATLVTVGEIVGSETTTSVITVANKNVAGGSSSDITWILIGI